MSSILAAGLDSASRSVGRMSFVMSPQSDSGGQNLGSNFVMEPMVDSDDESEDDDD